MTLFLILFLKLNIPIMRKNQNVTLATEDYIPERNLCTFRWAKSLFERFLLRTNFLLLVHLQ